MLVLHQNNSTSLAAEDRLSILSAKCFGFQMMIYAHQTYKPYKIHLEYFSVGITQFKAIRNKE